MPAEPMGAIEVKSDTNAWASLEPYAQLVKSLMPRASAVRVFDAEAQLRWSSESTTGPDLPHLVSLANRNALDDREALGDVIYLEGEGCPVYLWWLRNESGEFIATVAVSTRRDVGGEQQSFSFANAVVRPAMECLRRELAAQSSILALNRTLSVRDKDVELLLSVADVHPENGANQVDQLKELLQSSADHLRCALVALIVPEKSIALVRVGTGSSADASIVARTHRQLLQLTHNRREPLIINRVTSGANSEHAVPYRILAGPVRQGSGRVTGALALFRDLSAPEFEARDARLVELIARKASAHIEASYDALTGLLTRPALEQRARVAMGENSRAPHWSALYIDCDQLHAINESFGMHIGDGVLGQLGELIRRRLPPGALAARISGDRFAVLLPAEEDVAEEFAESLRVAAEQLGTVHATARLQMSVTIGVAPLELKGDALPHSLAAAESACKAGKDRGRNRVELYQEADVSIIRRYTDITVAGDLRDAIANNRLRLDAQIVQPMASSDPGDDGVRPVHFELLIRMLGLRGEIMGPDRFLSAAQRYQMMPVIDRWVVEQALSQLKPFAELLANRAVVFNLNFSGQSLNDHGFCEFLIEALENSGIDPGVFCFELTESDAVQNIVKAEVLMRKLRRLGCGVALDDFGTGLSSLSYLRSLPVTLLKIDGSFVRDILKDPRAESMVQAIAQLAHTMGIATVAEYVETDEIHQRLHSLGVDYAQGFAIGKPLPFQTLLDELPLYLSVGQAPPPPVLDTTQTVRRFALG